MSRVIEEWDSITTLGELKTVLATCGMDDDTPLVVCDSESCRVEVRDETRGDRSWVEVQGE